MINKINEYIDDYNVGHSPYKLSLGPAYLGIHRMTLTNLMTSLCVDVAIDIERMSQLQLSVEKILDTHVRHMTDMLINYGRGR